MPENTSVVYLDSSAIVKLIVQEPESDALRHFLNGFRVRVSSDLARVEVPRAVARLGPQLIERSRQALLSLYLLRMGSDLLEVAAALRPITLRSLDAIHLASAQALGSELHCVVTYDSRMAESATLLGLHVEAPR